MEHSNASITSNWPVLPLGNLIFFFKGKNPFCKTVPSPQQSVKSYPVFDWQLLADTLFSVHQDM